MYRMSVYQSLQVVVKGVSNTFIVVSIRSSIHPLYNDAVDHVSCRYRLMDYRYLYVCVRVCVASACNTGCVRVVVVDNVVLVSIIRFIHRYPIIQIPIHPSFTPLQVFLAIH